MEFNPPLQQGVFKKRYNRFFAEIEYKGEIITAHLPNTGSLKGALYPQSECFFSISDNPTRKLKYTLELTTTPDGILVGVNTSLPNKIMKDFLTNLSKVGISNRFVPGDHPFRRWASYTEFRPEYKISPQSRIDFLLFNPMKPEKNSKIIDTTTNLCDKHFLEVKSVTLAENQIAKFPDSVTLRGQKHLKDLMSLIDQGFSSEIVFIIQRNDTYKFAPSTLIDPEYSKLLVAAKLKGVEITPLVLELSATSANLTSIVLPLNFQA